MTGCLIGSTIGRFRLTELIGAGATGAVYRGVHLDIGHEVAVKTLRTPAGGVARTRQLSRRFVGEAQALAQLAGCPSIISVYDFGRLPDGRLYYVMELLHGRDLEHVLSHHGPLGLEQVTVYLQQICQGLEHAHRRGVVHRDLKPANVFVCPGELPRVVLLDFGIALDLHAHTAASSPAPKDPTGHGTLGVVGSPIYAAPEQISRKHGPIGPWSDIYALGVLSYQLITGELPFAIPANARPYQLLTLPLSSSPKPLAAAAEWLPPPLCALIDSCLARDSHQRPSSAGEFFEAYLGALADRLPGVNRLPALGLSLTPLTPTLSDSDSPARQRGQRLGASNSGPHPARPSSWTGSFSLHWRRAKPARGATRLSVAAMLCALLLSGAQRPDGPGLSGAHASAGPQDQAVACQAAGGPQATPPAYSGELELRVQAAVGTHCEAIIGGKHFATPPRMVPTRAGCPTSLVLACDGHGLEKHTTGARSGQWVIKPRLRIQKARQADP